VKHNPPGAILTPTENQIKAEIQALALASKSARRGKSGPPIGESLLEFAAAWALIERMNPNRKIHSADVEGFLYGWDSSRWTGDEGRPELRRLMKSETWRRVLGLQKLQGHFLEGPFMHAVAIVLRGMEGGKKPTQRDLMRVFRVPGKKNCSAADLAQFQAAINGMAADIASWQPASSDE